MKAVVIYRRSRVDMLLGEQEAQVVEVPGYVEYKSAESILPFLHSESYQGDIELSNVDQVIWLDEGVFNEHYDG